MQVDDEVLSRFAEGTLTGKGRRRLLRHLAETTADMDVYADTVEVLMALEAEDEMAQVERLARDFMGWKPWETGMGSSGTYTVYVNGLWVCHGNPLCDQVMFSPFTDANADYQVLQRARVYLDHDGRRRVGRTLEAVWLARFDLRPSREDEPAKALQILLSLEYEPGDYARAALAVLDSQETNP